MNIARLFTAYRLLENDLDRERQAHELTRQEAKAERERLIDAFARARGASAVYAPPPPPEDPLISRPAVGPTMTAARAAARKIREERARRQPSETEIEAAARRALESQPPPSRPNGDAEDPVPIAPDKLL